MSTLAEIEEALPKLTKEELLRVEALLNRLLRGRAAAAFHVEAEIERALAGDKDSLPQRVTAPT